MNKEQIVCEFCESPLDLFKYGQFWIKMCATHGSVDGKSVLVDPHGEIVRNTI